MGVGHVLGTTSVVWLLLGVLVEVPAGLVIARVLGSALRALGVACGLAASDVPGRATAGVLAAMPVYNLAAVLVLAHARLGLGMSGVTLVPAIVLHAALCVGCTIYPRPPCTNP
jgi:hypothetical protein